MRSLSVRVIVGCLLAAAGAASATAADKGPSFSRKEDVIYGRKHGMALTMDVFTPKKANGAAIILVMSGGWFSSHDWVSPAVADEFLKRGYTVFAVVHGSQPKFSIPEILEDINRAVRHIRYHAGDYHIDPNRIGIQGGSAGGHLSLMQGTAGTEGDPKAKDPVDRVSSRVQAVACFFPPTDFLNYGEKGKDALGRGTLAGYKAPFDFTELDKKTGSYVLITDEDRRREIGRKISPVNHVTKESAPALIIHGDADKLVPIQQAEEMVGRLKAAGVPAKLVVKQGAGHGWKGLDKDMTIIADWFDRFLRENGPRDTPPPGSAPAERRNIGRTTTSAGSGCARSGTTSASAGSTAIPRRATLSADRPRGGPTRPGAGLTWTPSVSHFSLHVRTSESSPPTA
jgi:acetyl esterase/lipase